MRWVALDGAVNVRDLGGLPRDDGRSTVAQRFIYFSTDPKPVQQHRQLPRYRDYGSFPGILAATLTDAQSIAAQVTVLSTWP